MNLSALPIDHVHLLLGALSDIVWVTDMDGLIQDLTVTGKELQRLRLDEWKGKIGRAHV